MSELYIPNWRGEHPLRVATAGPESIAKIGPLLIITLDSGEPGLSHTITPRQARQMAQALIDLAAEAECIADGAGINQPPAHLPIPTPTKNNGDAVCAKKRAPKSSDLVDETEAAEILDVVPGTLQVWRSTGRYGIPFIKVGRKIRYSRAALNAWLESRTSAKGVTP